MRIIEFLITKSIIKLIIIKVQLKNKNLIILKTLEYGALNWNTSNIIKYVIFINYRYQFILYIQN